MADWRAEAPLRDRDRADLLWAGGTALASAVLFALVQSPHPALSDASEAPAAIASLGIMHAPGYPSYELFAKAFTLAEPFGDLTLRLGIFSLLCAAASVGVVQLLARRMGAARWAATVGALCLASSGSYWYYAAFTKHDMFSGLCFAVSLYLLLSWDSRPNRARLIGLAAAIGIGLGSSWPLEVLLGPAVLFVLVRRWRALSATSLVAASVVGVVLVLGAYGFVLLRAQQYPAVDWGSPTTPSALVQLIDRANFTTSADNAAGTSAGSAATAKTLHSTTVRRGRSRRTGDELGNYIVLFWREFGPAGLILAAWGALAALAWRRRRASLPLLLAFGFNLAGAIVETGIESSTTTYNQDLVEEGFLFGCLFVLAVWLSVGATGVVGWVRTLMRSRSLTVRNRSLTMPSGRWPAVALAGVLAAAVLIPFLPTRWDVAHRSDNAYADEYAQTVFSELPRHSVLFLSGADLNLPLTYRQVVYGERRDVVVISFGGLRFAWYRKELDRLLPRPLPSSGYTLRSQWVAGIRAITGRPVYVDEQAADALKGMLPSVPEGLVLRVLPAGSTPRPDPAQLERTLISAERAAGLPAKSWNVYPNEYLLKAEYADVGLKAAGLFYAQHDTPGMKQALLNVVRIDPRNEVARHDLSELAASQIVQLP